MFKQTIEALKAAEAAAQADLDALLVPVERNEYGHVIGGGFHWHAAGSGLLTNLLGALAATRADFEKRQASQDALAETPTEPSPEPSTEAGEGPTPELEPETPAPGNTDPSAPPEPTPAPVTEPTAEVTA